MIQLEGSYKSKTMISRLTVADNTGAKEVACIKVLGGTRRRFAGLGDIIVCSVKSVIPGSDIKKKSVVRAVIVRCKQPTRRTGWQLHPLRQQCGCDHRSADRNPRGTRGSLERSPASCGRSNFMKIVSLASEVRVMCIKVNDMVEVISGRRPWTNGPRYC